VVVILITPSPGSSLPVSLDERQPSSITPNE
jgi:hypothetical protein